MKRAVQRSALPFLFVAVALSACASSPRAGTRALLMNPSDAEWSRPAPPVSRIRFETSKGDFVAEVTRAWAPLGADRFYNLARLGFYDDARFHRVIDGYIVQFGLSGDPAVPAAWRGHELRDDPPRSDNARGTFTFAHMGPDTRLTQIYINLGDNHRNDAEPFSILGRIVEGMAVLDALYDGYGNDSGSGMRQGRQGPIEPGRQCIRGPRVSAARPHRTCVRDRAREQLLRFSSRTARPAPFVVRCCRW
jgi:homoserine O-acetyltransferase